MSDEKQGPSYLDQYPQTPLIELASGVAVRPDKILFIARQELNKYAAFFPSLPVQPILNGNDLDVLRSLGVLQRIKLVDETGAEVKDKPANDSKIEVADK